MPVSEHISCEHCGYDLFGLPSYRCPECGRWVKFKRRFVPGWHRKGGPLASIGASAALIGSATLGILVGSEMGQASGFAWYLVLVPFLEAAAGFALTLSETVSWRNSVHAAVAVAALTLLINGALGGVGAFFFASAFIILPWLAGAYLGNKLQPRTPREVALRTHLHAGLPRRSRKLITGQ